MGKFPRRRQKRLGEKLLQIRETLELSQSEILRYMGLDEQYSRNIISNYEKDHREPPLFVLLGYARWGSDRVKYARGSGYGESTSRPLSDLG